MGWAIGHQSPEKPEFITNTLDALDSSFLPYDLKYVFNFMYHSLLQIFHLPQDPGRVSWYFIPLLLSFVSLPLLYLNFLSVYTLFVTS